MKAFFIIGILAFSMTALADPNPAVGDFARLKGKGPFGIDVQLDTYNKEFNAQTNEYRILVEVFAAGSKRQEIEDWTPRSELLGRAEINQVLINCGLDGGEIEQVEAMGTFFTTCKMKYEDENGSGHVWIGQVPFGVVRNKGKSQGNKFDLLITEFEYGPEN